MDPRDLIALAIAGLAAAWLLRRAWRRIAGSGSVGCHGEAPPKTVQIDLPER